MGKNICSVLLERGCSEIEKLEGEVSFLRENFSFPRSDSCLTERSEVQTVQIEEKKSSLEEKKSLRAFLLKANRFFSSTDTFSMPLRLHDLNQKSFMDAPCMDVIYGCP